MSIGPAQRDSCGLYRHANRQGPQVRSTLGRFGSLIDAYTIPQSVSDGATVPIFYEARLPELVIEGPESLDRLYETMFGDEPLEIQLKIRRRYANKRDGG